MGILIDTDLRVLFRQEHHNDRVSFSQDIFRDPHGNVVRFTAQRHVRIRDQGSDFAKAENLVDGKWHTLVEIYHGNLPDQVGQAMAKLMLVTGQILNWPQAGTALGAAL